MRLDIVPNHFAPKCVDRDDHFDTRNSHAIYTSPCNFKCAFCYHGVKGNRKAKNDVTLNSLESTIKYLITYYGRMFKITGGEPTLLPELKDILNIIKKNNGTVFLDTNGSRSKIVIDLIQSDLVDVLGISLKGLDAESATKTSGVEKELCWDSVLSVISQAANFNVRLIVTYVVYDNVDIDQLISFLDMLHSLNKNLYFKINNLYGENRRDKSLVPLSETSLKELIRTILERRPEWTGKIILIDSLDCVTNYESIHFY